MVEVDVCAQVRDGDGLLYKKLDFHGEVEEQQDGHDGRDGVRRSSVRDGRRAKGGRGEGSASCYDYRHALRFQSSELVASSWSPRVG